MTHPAAPAPDAADIMVQINELCLAAQKWPLRASADEIEERLKALRADVGRIERERDEALEIAARKAGEQWDYLTEKKRADEAVGLLREAQIAIENVGPFRVGLLKRIKALLG